MSDFSFRFQTPPTLTPPKVLVEANTGFGMPPPKPPVIPPLTKVETKTQVPALTPVKTTPVNPLNPLGGPDFGFSVTPQDKLAETTQPTTQPSVQQHTVPRYVPSPFPKTGDNIQVGDLVKRRDGGFLYNDNEAHPYAVVVSLAPFVLYSRHVDVYWQEGINPEQFVTTGKASSSLFLRCSASFAQIEL